MRILIIRHGDPDYKNDCLTEKGKREVALLADQLMKEKINCFYVSPLGRARETAEVTLHRLKKEGMVCDWLREFSYPITQDDGTPQNGPWDLMPAHWTRHKENFNEDTWGQTDAMQSGKIREKYDAVTEQLDNCIAKHGYLRKERFYKVEKANKDTIAFFCHFGVEMVILSHLLNLPVVPLWHGMVAAPSSVTSIYTEERQKGIASFRMNRFGDVSHLYIGEEPISFQARFCEIYDDMTQRH